MPNNTRSGLKISGLKISGKRSDGGMNPPQSPDLNITEAVWDHLDRERNKKGSQHPKKSFEMSFKKSGELFLKTT